MDEKKYGFNTTMIHAGFKPDKETGSMALPIYQTTAYEFPSAEHARQLFLLEKPGNIYTRITNPTQDVLEKRIAALEGGVGALALASGHSAIFLTLVNLAKAGDEIVASNLIYGGAINLLGVSFKKLGIDVKFVDPRNPENFRAATTNKTKAYIVEAIGNPNSDVADISAIADIAHSFGLPFIVDSTLATPYLLKPIEYGADIVIHSATKYLGGHGTSMAGVVVDSGKFDYANGNFPEFTSPDESYHGIVYSKDCGPAAFITKLRVQLLRDFGPAISPFNAFMIVQGIETLSLRMERHCKNADIIANYLNNHPNVIKVNYPNLQSDPNYNLAKKYLPKGVGSTFTFTLSGGKEAGIKFIDSLELIYHAANLGDARTLVVHPASTTHSQLTSEQLRLAMIDDGTIRISVGIEDAEDLIADLDQAIKKSV